jgi:hypothetical protein
MGRLVTLCNGYLYGLLSAGSVGIAASDLADEAVKAMDGLGTGQEHVRTFSGHDLNPSLVAERDGFRANGAFAGGAVHPDATDSGLGTIGNYFFGHCGRGHQERSVDSWLDVLQASETSPSEHVGSVGIYGNHIVPTAAKLFKEGDADAAGFPRDPDHRYSFLSEEIVDCFERDSLGRHVPS